MKKSQMKNIVVLKNLPSNLIEEAFVILKSNKLAKEVVYTDLLEEKINDNSNKKPDYIIKEAEMIIMNYINNNNKKKTNKKEISSNLKWIKIYSFSVSILLILAIISNFI